MKVHAVAVVVGIVLCGCRFTPRPPPDPCDPNPCIDANRTVCLKIDTDDYQCVCDDGFVQRPTGACEAVSVANCPEHTGDAAEPDDCPARAKAFATTDPVRNQSLEPAGDYDYFRIQAAAKRVYAVGLNASGTSLYPRLDVFDANGSSVNWVEYPVDSTEPDYHQRPTVFFKNRGQVDAPFFVRVMHSPLDPSVASGAYSVEVISPGLDNEPDDPSENPPRAFPDLASSGSRASHAGVLEYPFDQDMWIFAATAGKTYHVYFDPQLSLEAVAVYSATNYDPSAPLFTAKQTDVVFSVPASGDYLLAVYSSPPLTEAQSYRFNLVYE